MMCIAALSLPKSSSDTERQVFVSSFVHAWWASSSSSLDQEKTLKLSWHIPLGPSPQTAMQSVWGVKGEAWLDADATWQVVDDMLMTR